MKFLVLQDNFECCSYKRFDGLGNCGRSAHIYKTHLFWVLFLSWCHLFHPRARRRVGGAWVAGWVLCVTAQPHNGSTKEWAGGGGREGKRNLLLCAEQRTSWLLLCCRAGPLLMPGWPIVWVASSAHAPPSSSSFTLLLFLPPPLPHSLYSAIISTFQCARRDYYVVNWCVFRRKIHPAKPIIKKRRSRLLWSTVLIPSPFVRLRRKNKGDALGSVRSTKVVGR